MFLLPVSCLYDLWFYTRSKIVFALSSAPTKHKEKVEYVQQQVQSHNQLFYQLWLSVNSKCILKLLIGQNVHMVAF